MWGLAAPAATAGTGGSGRTTGGCRLLSDRAVSGASFRRFGCGPTTGGGLVRMLVFVLSESTVTERH